MCIRNIVQLYHYVSQIELFTEYLDGVPALLNGE